MIVPSTDILETACCISGMTMIVPSTDILETACCMSDMMISMQRPAKLAVIEQCL